MSFSKIFNLKCTCVNFFKNSQLLTRQFSRSNIILCQKWKYPITLGVIATSYFLVNFSLPKSTFFHQKKINYIFDDALIEINRTFSILAKETDNSQVLLFFFSRNIYLEFI